MSLTFFEKKPALRKEDVRIGMDRIDRFVDLLGKASDNPFNSQAEELLVKLSNTFGETINQSEITESKKLT